MDDSDLAIPFLIYMAAMLCGLALVVVPVYLANRPTVLPNPVLPTVEAALATRAGRRDFPVARLKDPAVVSPATLAALKAKPEKAKHVRQARAQLRPRAHLRRSFAQAAPHPDRAGYPLFATLF